MLARGRKKKKNPRRKKKRNDNVRDKRKRKSTRENGYRRQCEQCGSLAAQGGPAAEQLSLLSLSQEKKARHEKNSNGKTQTSASGARSQVARAKAEYPSQLDYSGSGAISRHGAKHTQSMAATTSSMACARLGHNEPQCFLGSACWSGRLLISRSGVRAPQGALLRAVLLACAL